MYVEKFVSTVKSGDKFLRDENGLIKIPFGTEYGIYLKNLESRTAVVSVSIDGKDVLDGKKLVIPKFSNIELEGFVEGNQVNNRFKFIQLTKEIEDHLGYNPEDSIIRIEFQYEKIKPILTTTCDYRWNNVIYPYQHYYYDVYTSGTIDSSSNYNIVSLNNIKSYSVQDTGVTVKGNECQQNFVGTYVDELENKSNVIILRLSGYINNKKTETIIATKDKIECPTCGKKNNYKSKFCNNCGTFLK